jgi:hypothetical protein
MNRKFLHPLLPVFVGLSLILFCTAISFGEENTHKGWEIESKYNSYYNYKERDSLKGKVTKFKKITPLEGMQPGTAFLLDEGGEEILVHLCPWDYASPKETGIRTGVVTKVKGAWAEINGEDVFMAAKVKQGEDFQFKVRLTKDGKPFWTMGPEELAKELNSE